MPSLDDLNRRFSYHPPVTAVDRQLHEDIRALFKAVAVVLARDLPESRELSLCITALEEAMFWANACVARARAD